MRLHVEPEVVRVAAGVRQQQLGRSPRRVLVASPVGTDPASEGHCRRVQDLCVAMTELGCEVWFLYLPVHDFPSPDVAAMAARWNGRVRVGDESWPLWPVAARQAIRQYARPYLAYHLLAASAHLPGVGAQAGEPIERIDDEFDDRWCHQARRLHRQLRFDVVIAVYVFFSRLLEVFPANVVKVIDTIDVFADRSERLALQGVTDRWRSTTAAAERRALRRADVVLAIQEDEATYFREQSLPNVASVGHLAPPPQRLDRRERADPSMVMVASWNPVNQRGLEWLVAEVLPRVRLRVPAATLNVVGNLCKVTKVQEQPGVRLLGCVDDLADVYRSAYLAVNPVATGTGLAIKSIEALFQGVPLVATPAGARGLSAAIGRGMTVGATSDEFAAAVADLLESPTASRVASEAAWRFGQEFRATQLDRLADVLATAPAAASATGEFAARA